MPFRVYSLVMGIETLAGNTTECVRQGWGQRPRTAGTMEVSPTSVEAERASFVKMSTAALVPTRHNENLKGIRKALTGGKLGTY